MTLNAVLIAVAVAVALTAFAVILVVIVRRKTGTRRERIPREFQWYSARHELELARQRTDQIVADGLDGTVVEKRTRFLNLPNVAFHFFDAEQIQAFYNDYFKEPTVASLVSELTGEVDASVTGTIPQILESRLGAKDLTKWISNIKMPDATPNGMFLRYQRETIRSGQVALALEEVDVELTDLQTFDALVEQLRGRYEVSFEETALARHRGRLREQAAERTMLKLEQAAGWVLVEGRFLIHVEGDYYRCSYRHPVNDYLPTLPQPVTISIAIPKAAVAPRVAGNYAASVGRSIPLRVYGQVWQPVDRRTNVYDLHLTPLAVY